jgi:uncharacterized damage-inducible protein DinB
MSTAALETLGQVEVFRAQARMIADCVRLNLSGVTQVESLIQPRPAGNSLNWVLGHLLWVYEISLPMLGEEPVWAEGALQRYIRGTQPLRDSAEALDFGELVGAWEEAVRRFDVGLSRLTVAALDAPAASHPGADPGETIRSLLTGLLFHQAYHTGQLGVLRRLVGREGAIP